MRPSEVLCEVAPALLSISLISTNIPLVSFNLQLGSRVSSKAMERHTAVFLQIADHYMKAIQRIYTIRSVSHRDISGIG